MTKLILVFTLALSSIILIFVILTLVIVERTNTDAALIRAKNPGCKFEKTGLRGFSSLWLMQGPSNTVNAIVRNGDIIVIKEFFKKEVK